MKEALNIFIYVQCMGKDQMDVHTLKITPIFVHLNTRHKSLHKPGQGILTRNALRTPKRMNCQFCCWFCCCWCWCWCCCCCFQSGKLRHSIAALRMWSRKTFCFENGSCFIKEMTFGFSFSVFHIFGWKLQPPISIEASETWSSFYQFNLQL